MLPLFPFLFGQPNTSWNNFQTALSLCNSSPVSSSALHPLLNGVSYHSLSISSARPSDFDSSSRYHIQVDRHIRHITLSVFGEPGYMATTAMVYKLYFVPATGNFDAFTHGKTCSARLIVNPKNSYRKIVCLRMHITLQLVNRSAQTRCTFMLAWRMPIECQEIYTIYLFI